MIMGGDNDNSVKVTMVVIIEHDEQIVYIQ